jgi:cell division protein FtsW
VLGAAILAVGVIAGVPLVHVGSVAMVGAVGAFIAIWSDPRRFNRLTAFRDIEGNKEHLAWQSWQGLLGIANGGLTGSGIGGSRQDRLPAARAQRLHLRRHRRRARLHRLGRRDRRLRAPGVVRGPDRARRTRPVRACVLAGGIAVWFGVQAIVNIGGVAGMMPVTGLTLPFFSAGGTSLFVSMVAWLLLNVARRRCVTVPRPRCAIGPIGERLVR